MKAVVIHGYGSSETLKIEEIDRPVPADDEMVIRVRAASVNAGDWHLMRGDPWLVRLGFGLCRPRIKVLGADAAGTVVAVGAGVQEFQVGDEVIADLSASGFGGFAGYAGCKAEHAAKKPAGLDFPAASALPSAGTTALQGIRDHGRVRAGESVLINGASGGVGSYAVQIAAALGARVTAVCGPGKEELMKSLGAEHVIDYTNENFTEGTERYDLIYAANGNYPLKAYRRVLKPRGRCVVSGGEGNQFLETALRGPLLSKKNGQRFAGFIKKTSGKDLAELGRLTEEGKLKPLIDRSYPLEGTPEAIAYLEQGHARGKVIITLEVEE
jgi:NADPH:quinone reductase-like Zn-dependent oxidoreductase